MTGQMRVVVEVLIEMRDVAQVRTLVEAISDGEGRIEAQAIVEALAYDVDIALARAVAEVIMDPTWQEEIAAVGMQELMDALRVAQGHSLLSTLLHIVEPTDAEKRSKWLAQTGVMIALARVQDRAPISGLIHSGSEQPFDPEKEGLMQMAVALGYALDQHIPEAMAMIDAVEALLRAFPDADALVLTAKMLVLTLAQRWEDALALLEQIGNDDLRTLSQVLMVSALAQAKRWEDTHALLAQITNEEVRTQTQVLMVGALAQAEHWEETYELLAQITNEEARIQAQAVIVDGLISIQEWETAITIAQEIAYVQKRAEVQRYLGQALAAAHRFDLAQALIETMGNNEHESRLIRRRRRRDVADERIAVQVAVSAALVAAQRWEEAQANIQAMIAQARHIVPTNQIGVVQTQVAEALAQTQRLEEALGLIDQITNAEQRAQAQRQVVAALAQTERLEEAIGLLDQIADAKQRAQARWQVVVAQAQGQRLDEVLSRLDQLTDVEQRIKAQVALAIALAQALRLDEAYYLVTQITDILQRAPALWAIAEQIPDWAPSDTSLRVHLGTAPLDLKTIIHSPPPLPHLPTVLTLVQHQWSQATRRDDLYNLLPAATPLFLADPTLLPQILAGEQWVQEQLTW
jgi:tetratricopeptide (TPR) repeat protein